MPDRFNSGRHTASRLCSQSAGNCIAGQIDQTIVQRAAVAVQRVFAPSSSPAPVRAPQTDLRCQPDRGKGQVPPRIPAQELVKKSACNLVHPGVDSFVMPGQRLQQFRATVDRSRILFGRLKRCRDAPADFFTRSQAGTQANLRKASGLGLGPRLRGDDVGSGWRIPSQARKRASRRTTRDCARTAWVPARAGMTAEGRNFRHLVSITTHGRFGTPDSTRSPTRARTT